MYRALLMVGLTVAAIVMLIPSLVTNLPSWWTAILPTEHVRLGLDLRGGTHLVLTVEVDKAIEHTMERYVEEIKHELPNAKIQNAKIEHQGQKVIVHLASPDDAVAFKDMLAERFGTLTVEDSSIESGAPVLRVGLTKPEDQRLRDFAVQQSIETIRNRIDQLGVTEPIIQRQGDDGILVQLPGIQEPERAKDLIGRTAVLEFKLLPAEATNPAQYTEPGKQPPPGTTLLYGPEYNPVTGTTHRVPYLVENQTLMTGDVVADARVRPQTKMEGPSVELDLNARGAKIFDEITAANVGRRMAITLDNTVYSAPVIRERISGGRANISGSFDIKEARDLAIVLRAGALPAPVVISEERTVGPTLGADSIREGLQSFAVGGALVLIFMVIYYRFAGVLADMAVILNIIFLAGSMAALGSTLTLPGIAGIVLTLGMAVDANVLINERIREELRLGKSARAAIDAGYERALPAILDSNITTFLSGIILFQFGSGPVRGFAVTLCIGIVSSVITAVVGTRVVYDYLLMYRRLQTVSV